MSTSTQTPIVTMIVKQPSDWIGARQRAQVISAGLGFSTQDQTRVATAISEIARNAWEYANGGKVEFIAETVVPQSLLVRISDSGPGIAAIEQILAGTYQSPHGLGIGITGSRKLMDEFTVDTRMGVGTTVHLRKFLPRNAARITPTVVARVSDDLSRRRESPLQEAQQHNQELLITLDELARVNRELTAANEARDVFLATVSHELRTPMTSILGWLQMLREPDLTEALRVEGMAAIESSARIQARLIDDVLEAARAQSGKLSLELANLDLREVIESMLGILQPAVNERSVILHRQAGTEVLCMSGDAIRLQQILWNLVSNAIRFTSAGGTITLGASLEGDRVKLTVADDGVGIGPDLLPHVFERFRQGDDSRQHGGLGLGLAIVQHLVHLHAGTITVASEGAGKGTCFTILFPLLRQ